eukprot:Skav233603  [mRNA]  locus=scaffold109:34194:42421:+ [translate_table: standard]
MLTVHKNRVVSDVTLQQAAVRQKESPVRFNFVYAQGVMNFPRKGKVEEGGKKKARKAQKFQKAIVGMSLDDIKKKQLSRRSLGPWPRGRPAQKFQKAIVGMSLDDIKKKQLSSNQRT